MDVSEFVADEAAAVVLGKALFWDQQMGSDGFVACATCHYHFGIDVRTANTVAPGGHGSAQAKNFTDLSFYGPGKDLTPEMFPFHEKVDPLKRTIDFPDTENLVGENVDPNDDEENILRDNDDIVGSQGIARKKYNGLNKIADGYAAAERGKKDNSATTKLFRSGNKDWRAVTGRNAPTTYGAAFHKRLFWDGRAENQFNGVNGSGDRDKKARVWKANSRGTRALKKRISIDNAALASLATEPPLDTLETSFIGRTFADLGKKMLTLEPLATQTVHPEDSVLGGGVLEGKTYADLVREAFKPEWYKVATVDGGTTTQMEANFSLFWGIAQMLYMRQLIPDSTRYDDFANSGFNNGFTEQEKEGLRIFLNEGKCADCHRGPHFAAAIVGDGEEPIETMQMQFGNVSKNYDTGFYNIGVSPTNKDLGIGGKGADGKPLSNTLRVPSRLRRGGPEAAVNGSFKVPTLRNVEYTGPYMHNGSMSTLRQVLEFYARGGNFANEADRAPNVNGIELLRDDPSKIDALEAFLHTLTDENSEINAAPFDHPSLIIKNGDADVEVEASGRDGIPGGRSLKEFDEILEEGGLTTENRTGVEEE